MRHMPAAAAAGCLRVPGGCQGVVARLNAEPIPGNLGDGMVKLLPKFY